MPEKMNFTITRTEIYTAKHSAYSREVIEELVKMKAPFGFQKMYEETVIKEIKLNATPNKTSER